MINFVNVGPAGTFENSGSYETKPSDVDIFFEQVKGDERDCLVLHFHGGLNDENAGVEIAKKMADVYAQANSIPLTFVWETGLQEVFRDNVARINEKVLYRKLLVAILRRLIERAKGKVGLISSQDVEVELAKDVPFSEFDSIYADDGKHDNTVVFAEVTIDAALKSELEIIFEQDVVSDPEIQVELDAHLHDSTDMRAKGILTGVRASKILALIAYRVIRRYVQHRDHGFYPTVVEELLRELYMTDLGAWVWGRMKIKAADMWASNEGRKGEEQFAGRYVLEKLAHLQANRKELRLVLVGHSAGSIAICEMLKVSAEQRLNIKFETIIFLAPAGQSKLGVEQLVRHQERFERFYMFTMRDDFESADQLVPKIYTRSLLYLVSGVLEPSEADAPIMGMMRHATNKKPFASGVAAEWAKFIGDQYRLTLSNSVKINPSAPIGERSSAIKHGGFDDDKATLESIKYLILKR